MKKTIFVILIAICLLCFKSFNVYALEEDQTVLPPVSSDNYEIYDDVIIVPDDPPKSIVPYVAIGLVAILAIPLGFKFVKYKKSNTNSNSIISEHVEPDYNEMYND